MSKLATKEEIFAEAVQRMVKLKLDNPCIEAFVRDGKVWESEGFGALYELNEKEQDIVNRFEKAYKDYLVYHVIHNHFEFGECYSLLFVSTEKSDWKEDNAGIDEGYVFAYVENTTDPWCSEFGSIAVKPSFGGLVRLG